MTLVGFDDVSIHVRPDRSGRLAIVAAILIITSVSIHVRPDRSGRLTARTSFADGTGVSIHVRPDRSGRLKRCRPCLIVEQFQSTSAPIGADDRRYCRPTARPNSFNPRPPRSERTTGRMQPAIPEEDLPTFARTP